MNLPAPHHDGDAMNMPRFSLASDIVELVVLTSDETLLQTLREAVGGARRLWHVLTADKVSDLLVAGEIGILVLDLETLSEAAGEFIEQIKRQFPDMVVVAAGGRGTEASLAALISAGTVYRFIHKPVSPARAKLFAEAAVKKYEEQRRRADLMPVARGATPRSAWTGGAIGIAVLLIVAVWAVQKYLSGRDDARRANTAVPTAAASLNATPPATTDPQLSAQTEVRERLLAQAENFLLEERLDDAAAAIEAARNAGADGARAAFLSAQLTKSRGQVKTAQAQIRLRGEQKAAEERISALLNLAAQRLSDGRLLEPNGDSAHFYLQEALKVDAASAAAHEFERTLGARLLRESRSASGSRDFVPAADRLEAAGGTADPQEIRAAEALLAGVQHQADADARAQLLTAAMERLQQERLIDPPNDSAKFYLLKLRSVDPGNAGLAPALNDLGARLLAKARRALVLEQYDAARNWLAEATALGFASGDLNSVRHDLDAAVAREDVLSHIVDAAGLALVKSVAPHYPPRAELNQTQGWVELDFTVTESGAVTDIEVHAASVPGVFEAAAIGALSQWRYKSIMRDGKPTLQRARIRIRFTLAK